MTGPTARQRQVAAVVERVRFHPPEFSVQLRDAYLYEAKLSRRVRGADETLEPLLEARVDSVQAHGQNQAGSAW